MFTTEAEFVGRDLPPDLAPGRMLVRRIDAARHGFGAGQPRLGRRVDLRQRPVAERLASTNQQFRRNVSRAVKAGVVVREGNIDDLPALHQLYLETAERDGSTARRSASGDRGAGP